MIDVNNLDIDRKIGQLIFAGFEGTEINEDIKELIREYKVGNIILFERNCKNPKQVFNLIKDLQSYAIKEIGIPLFISIDQENGIVTRLYEGVTHFPGNMALGETGEKRYAYEVGKCMGEELEAIGINFNLAPCVDINNNEENPVIGVRSFGSEAKIVSDFAINMIKGMQEGGIISTIKHFPGHGDTMVDSHLGLPRITHNKERLEKIELAPFKECINSGVKAVMIAHIVFEAYEKENIPATLSKNIVTNLLREELNFKGLVITDCMEMNSIKDYYGTGIGTKKAIEAGADLVCISHTKEKQKEGIDLIKKAVLEGEISKERIDESVIRILKEKENYKPKKEYEDIKHKLYKEENLKLSREISEKSIKIVKNENIIPVKNKKVLVISIEPQILTGVEGARTILSIGESIKEGLKDCNVDYVNLSLSMVSEQIEKIKILVKQYDVIICCTYNGKILKNQLEMVREVMKVNENVILIPMRIPYDYLELKEVKGCILPYEYTNNSVKSIVKVLKG